MVYVLYGGDRVGWSKGQGERKDDYTRTDPLSAVPSVIVMVLWLKHLKPGIDSGGTLVCLPPSSQNQSRPLCHSACTAIPHSRGAMPVVYSAKAFMTWGIRLL